MNSEYILVKELRNYCGYIYYVFKHMETGKFNYYFTCIGDGFIQTESITKEIFDYAMDKYFAEVTS